MKSNFDGFLAPIPESLGSGEYVIATYLLGAPPGADIQRRAVALALEQTTGTWASVPFETKQVREQSAGRVISILSVPDYEAAASVPADSLRWYVLRIGFPWVNFYDNLPLLLSSVIGNISAMVNLKLLDLEFPGAYIQQFKGPKFGGEGIRQILGVHDRPLLNNMIKPCTGFSPEVGSQMFYEAAVGGVDWVKDDELLGGSPAFSPVAERVAQYMDAARRAEQVKGEKTLYTVNITDEVGKMREHALRAIEAGGNALMVNIFATGFSAFRALAEDPEIGVPIAAHTAFSGAMSSSPTSGISSIVGAKLARICGADLFLDYVPSVKFGGIYEKFLRIKQVCSSPFYHLKPVMTHAGGGITPGTVPYILSLLGTEVALGAGGGIHGHPMGAKAGARAMRQAIDAVMREIPLEDAAQDFAELEAALEAWGMFGEEKYKQQFALAG
jgi:2,3-diketo-5-methylthiopentyl-1-phosphate enolase